MRTETLTLTILSLCELEKLLQPHLAECGVTTFRVEAEGLVRVASDFLLDTPVDYTLQQVWDGLYAPDGFLAGPSLAEFLAAMAGLDLIPRTDYLVE